MNETAFNQNLNVTSMYLNYENLRIGSKAKVPREFNLITLVNKKNLFYVFGGNDLIFHLLLSIESIVYQYVNKIVGFIVPFFNVIYNMSRTPFLLAVKCLQLTLFQIPIIDQFSFTVSDKVEMLYDKSNASKISFVGQGNGATIAKRIVSEPSKSFLTGVVYDGFSPENSFYSSKRGYSQARFVYNIVSSLVIGSEEVEWMFNQKVDAKEVYPTVTDAFCMTAAMCAPNNRYVSLCEQLGVSKEKYAKWIQNPIVTHKK